MVPKVNSGANVYGVLQYNRIKVEADEGRILYMQGIPERSDGRFSIEECAEAFGYYTALNPRVRKPVVHFSLNPSPEDRLSEAQLTQLAAEFMERMGYGRQPYVVFLHEDIARRHMHVVSVRVDEQGRKIDHNNELRRAMAVCRELEHEYGLHVPEDGGVQTEPEELHRVDYLRSDLKHQLRNVVMTLKQQYGFQSLAEFNTLLERYGLAAEEVRGDVRGRPYRGLVYHVLDDDGQRTGAAVKASRLGDFFGWKALEELNSTCKCNRILINNLFKFFVWREVSKSFTRSIIEFIFNPLNLFVGYFTKVLTLWDILPDKPVGVFIGTTFP